MELAVTRLLRNTRHLIWLNSLFLVALAISLLYIAGGISMEVVLFIPVVGLFVGMGNYTFTNKFLVKNPAAELIDSYEKVRETILFDELTGIYNRRAGLERLREEFARSLRSEKEMSIAMVDIDNFKGVNDTYGHQAGDHVLKSVAAALKCELRSTDIVFRYGGEEFMVIMPETDEFSAVIPLDRLREKLSGMKVKFGSAEIITSVSIGVSTVFNSEQDVEKAVNRADSALYRAKKTGRIDSGIRMLPSGWKLAHIA